MKYCRPLIPIFILYFFLFSSCENKKEITVNAVTFDSIQIAETYHLFNDEKKPNCNLTLSFTYPVQYKDPAILKALQETFVRCYFGENYAGKTPKEAVELYKNEYLVEYKNLEKTYEEELTARGLEGDDDASFFSYFENTADLILFNKADILTLLVESNSFTGGAHGSQVLSTFVIDMKTGQTIHESDIFLDNGMDKIGSLILQKIMEDNDVQNTKDLEYLGYDVPAILPNGNFTADDQGITYIFNQYEIAPYVMGITKVNLPYDEINLYMKKDNPLTILAGK